MKLRQIFCRHDWEYRGLDKEAGDSWFIYRCKRCGKVKAIGATDICDEIGSCPLTTDMFYKYVKEELYLPSDIYGRPYKCCGRRVAKVLEKYDKMGIDLRAYGRVECVMCDFDRARESAV